MSEPFGFNKDASLLIDRAKGDDYIKIEIEGDTREERIANFIRLQNGIKDKTYKNNDEQKQ